MPTDLVVFRRWKDTGDILAIFPEIPVDDLGRYCQSYDEMRQHIACDYEQVIHDTMPATPREYGRFARELTLLGYDLQPVRRATKRHHERRQENARRRQGNTRLSDSNQHDGMFNPLPNQTGDPPCD